MKHFKMISLLILSVLSICLIIPTTTSNYTVQAQKTTCISVMTLACFESSNSSSTITTDQPIENKTANYYTNSTGYLVYPSINQTGEKHKLPAVVLIHENKGLNDYIKESADLLAHTGIVVLAADLFNGEVTTDQNRSRELTTAIRENPDIAIDNLKAAVEYLQSLDNLILLK